MSASEASTRVLLVTSVPLERDQITRILDDTDLHVSSVRVLAPSLNDSALAFWVSDADAAIAEADAAAATTERAVAAAADDASVTSQVGDSDPLLAIGDALRIFPADRIVTVRRDGASASHLEDELDGANLERAFGLPVRAHVLGG